jgi:hypothetical protein
LRTSPYVALPFDSERERPELVGFSCFIPSRAARRGEDFNALRSEIREAHSKQTGGKGSWRRTKESSRRIAWRTCPDCSGRVELEETKQQNNYTDIVTD